MIMAVRAELSKFLSLPVIWGTSLVALIAPGILAVISATAARGSERELPHLESAGFEVAGFGQPLVILLAAFIVGSEFSAAQIRTSMLATPRRLVGFIAKIIVVTLSAGGIGGLATAFAVGLARAVGQGGLTAAPFTDSTWQNVGGVSMNYVLIALLAAAITSLARTPVVAVIVLVPMVLGLTVSLVSVVPVLRFLPDLAGMQLMMAYPGLGLLEPVPGAMVMSAWALVSLVVAGWVFVRRDVGG